MDNTKNRKRMMKILDETVEYYSGHLERRGTAKVGCCYDNGKGGMCAVGRVMEETKRTVLSPYLMGSGVDMLINEFGSLDALLKKEYRGLHTEFWLDVQTLHDNKHYWDVAISSSGKKFVVWINERVDQGDYDIVEK